MNGDPRCVICRGSGLVRDSYAGRDETCACTTAPKRDPYAPSQEGWAIDAIADLMRKAEARRAEQEAHAAACTDRPCRRCEKFVCACGNPFDGELRKRCDECAGTARERELLEPMRTSVPKRFRWAFDASAGGLCDRVRAPVDLLARALANPPSGDFTLTGDTAMGKTSLVVAMLDAWVRQDPESRRGARFVESYWLAGARARHPLGQGEAPDVAAAMGATLLVVDDLGSEVDDRRNVMQDVIFHRHNEELPTWITTGFSPEQIMNRYGSAVIRRMVEHGKRLTLGAK